VPSQGHTAREPADVCGVDPNVRINPTLVATLVLVAAPATFGHEYLIDPSDPMGWIGMSDAIARVRFESHHSVISSEETLTEHTAIVLGIFKRHGHLRDPSTRVTIIERRGFMQTEDGNWPCWDNEQPLPPGTEAIAFLGWDAARQSFHLGIVDSVRIGDRTLRVLGSQRLCELNEV
jgi:hypothetical protein